MSGRFRCAINKTRLDQTGRVIKGEKYRSFIKTRLNSTSNKRIDECVRKDPRYEYEETEQNKEWIVFTTPTCYSKVKTIYLLGEKNCCLLFSVNLYSCVPAEECAKKGLDTKEYSVLLLFSFFNIKHKIGTLLLLPCMFSFVIYRCFQSIFTLYICELFI